MRLIRKILGFLILKWDAFTAPVPMTREPAKQAQVEAETSAMTLYQLHACPFCVKVRREMRRLNLPIALKDVANESFERELLAGGKKDQVPCLRIDAPSGTTWLYESSAINDFLIERFLRA